MTAPIKNNQTPSTDPYANYEENDDDYGYEDEALGMGESYEDGFETGNEGTPPNSVTIDQARRWLNDLSEILRISDLSASEKNEIRKEIREIKGKINLTVTMSPGAQATALGQIQQRLLDLENRIQGVEEDGTPSGDSLRGQLEEFKKKVQDNPQLSEKRKGDWLGKLDKWLTTVALGLTDSGEDKISQEFEVLQEEYANASVYSGPAGNLGDLAGMDPAEIEALAKKHGVDLNNLPNPPDAKIAAMIAELPGLAELTQEVNSKHLELQSKIDNAVGSANMVSEANRSSDTSQKDTVDWTPFKFLYNAKFHRDDHSNALGQARVALAKEVANALTALYGTEVKALEDPEKMGMVSLNGTDLNAVAPGAAGRIGFSNTDPDWPPVELVEIYVDNEGNGKTTVPDWMKNSFYPYYIYDTDGRKGEWCWYDGGEVRDVGYRV